MSTPCVWVLPSYPGNDAAERAFAVMVRRGWGVFRNSSGQWQVVVRDNRLLRDLREPSYPDPFTALIVSDEWWEANSLSTHRGQCSMLRSEG